MDDYCKCGLALEDPLHYGWHKIKDWNDGVFANARKKEEEKFEKRLDKPKKKTGKESWTSLDI